jgi:hypothetical protein
VNPVPATVVAGTGVKVDQPVRVGHHGLVVLASGYASRS